MLSAVLAFAVAAVVAPPRIPAADLQADARLLRHALETLHPSLERYSSAAEVAAAFAALDADLREDRTLAEAYLAISRLTARIRCGHTHPNFFNQSKAVGAQLLDGTRRLPFFFRWRDGRMVVTRSFASAPALAPGTEVVAVDGIPAATLLARLVPLMRADGGNDAKRVSLLEVQGRAKYEAFDVYFPLVFPSDGATFALRVRAPGAAKETRIVVPAQSSVMRFAAFESLRGATAKDSPLWSFAQEGEVAVWTMPTWSTYNSTWDWKAALQAAFEQLAARRTRALVLDLRANEGGTDDVGRTILAHLTSADMPLRTSDRRVRYRRVPDDLAPHLDTWDPSFKDWGAEAVEIGGGFYRLAAKGDSPSVVRPAAPRFDGRVFVLTSAVNSSATFAFAQAVKQARLGTLVGATTGGNQRGTSGGAFFFLRLPRSGIEVDIPLIGYYPEGGGPDAGIDPDIAVAATAKDIAEGRDPEMEAVLKESQDKR